jgi:hypothetical protein
MEKFSWNKVTWYSQVLAIILFVGIFYLGYYFGEQAGREASVSQSIALEDIAGIEEVATSTNGDLIEELEFVCANNKGIHAKLYPNKADLVLSDERIMELNQTASPTGGARFANKEETIAFLNKGNSAYLWESGKTTFANCYVK